MLIAVCMHGKEKSIICALYFLLVEEFFLSRFPFEINTDLLYFGSL